MATELLYFYCNASDDAVSDPNSNWTSDAYLFDGSTGTNARQSAASTKTSKYLKAGGCRR